MKLSNTKKRFQMTGLLLALTLVAFAQQPLPYQNPMLSSEVRARDLCQRLTLEEKALIMTDESPAIDRLGIPAFHWWNEALHGIARNGTATVFPITMAMAASWDEGLVRRAFSIASDEARAKDMIAKRAGHQQRYQGLSFWTPNINIFRDPRWGRGQETYGEDPFLTSRMGLSVVRGLQEGDDSDYLHRHPTAQPMKFMKTLACAKHFAIHSGPEWNRHQFNVEDVSPRDLWETYLPAFKALVQEGNVAEVMCAYQRWEGDPCCGSNQLLQQILRNEWDYKGLVVSDCWAINDFWEAGRHGVSANAHEASAKAVRSGTDVECGYNYRTLPEAVAAGEITEEQIDVSVIRLLKARFDLGNFDPDSLVAWTRIPESIVGCEQHKQTALQIAREGMVLLKNGDADGNELLPLRKDMRVVVMGANAVDSTMMWGNYNGYPTHTVTILEGIKQKVPQARFLAGCGLTRNIKEESLFEEMKTPDGLQGMRVTYWNNTTMEGAPTTNGYHTQGVVKDNGGATVFAPGVALENFSARYEGTIIPKQTGKAVLRLSGDDGYRIIINGDTLENRWGVCHHMTSATSELQLKAGEPCNVQIDYVQYQGVAHLDFDIVRSNPFSVSDVLAQTEQVDVVVFVGGISPRLEGEEMRVNEEGFKGGDRTEIFLPRAQREVLEALHQAGRKVVFVNCSGSAISFEKESDWADAILQAWYPGEQGGTAVADILFGDYNPSGRLPITFYKNVGQLPDFLDYNMSGRTYRYFTGTPQYCFGHGLSYTTFSYGKPKYKKGKLYVNVTNTGQRSGTEVVQVYVRDLADVEGPLKSLRAFQRVELAPNETRQVVIDLPRESFEGWDTQTNTIRVVPGRHEIMVGGSSSNDQLKRITVKIK
ncbi:MAG: glycoside hydrolase family 3 C-terminal domain-containing protein [Prevotella sp.]|nr:glycoside hydrolase family 3 C-terminal domain-containing protein [Prevotella sp.]